jgi:hypothetical protein
MFWDHTAQVTILVGFDYGLLKFKAHLQSPFFIASSHRRRPSSIVVISKKKSRRRRIYCKLKVLESLHLEFEGDVRVYLDYPEVMNLMRIVLPLIKIRLP